ncbi:unnamed protein product [Mytilus edulis]|uniref:Uncharacterized protein n=1 Tax=Mytilus edulis TaxID=6550 RepID=A0A8S3QDK4_MYTED|nr:unnamed protein product [Mytilus edulis]
MSSDESDGNFEGFGETNIINAEQEVLVAEERLRIILNEQGIGDDIDGNLIGNEDEGEQEVNICERGDCGDGWHNGFNIFERGLIYPSWHYWAKSRHGCWKGGHRFLATLYGYDPFLEFSRNKTDSYANFYIQLRPNDNKMPWSNPTLPCLPKIKAFCCLTYQMGISRKHSTKLYWSTDPKMSPQYFHLQ